MRPVLAVLAVLAAACGAPRDRSKAPTDVAGAASGPSASPAIAGPSRVRAPAGPLTLAQARRYMVELVNADRASMGLAPVVLDDGAATAAGQAHAEDMAKNGYLGHWGTDGTVPEQRHTDAGGVDMVLENASCFVDEARRVLDPEAKIDPKNIEKAESMFFNEEPPHDGHRRNILNPRHKKVGIGIAQPIATATEIPVPCFAQEFTDPYGTYTPVPKAMRASDTLHVEGTITAPATVGGVGLARVDELHALAPKDANTAKRRAYPVPTPTQLYWPPGFKTPIPVKVDGAHFSVDVPFSEGAGLYEVSVWARFPGAKDPVMVGLRTVHVK